MNARRAVAILLIDLVTWTAGCSSYREIHIDQIRQYERVRVTTTDSAQYDVQWPGIYGDTLRGPAPEPRILLQDVEKLEVKNTDAGKTTALVLGILAAAAGVAYAICAETGCFDVVE